MRVSPNRGLDKKLKSPYKEIFEIGTATGLRISDIITLKVQHLIIEKPTIIEQKTGKSKRIYIPKKTRDKLIRENANKNPDDYVFSSASKTGHITRQAVFKAFKKAGGKNVGTHTMRKNFALRMFSRGKGLKYVQNKLNHSALGETLLYLDKENNENEQGTTDGKNKKNT